MTPYQKFLRTLHLSILFAALALLVRAYLVLTHAGTIAHETQCAQAAERGITPEACQ